MQKIVMLIMAVSALLGGIDRLTGSRFGIGKKAEEAFELLGPITMSMAGILCMAPLLADLLGRVIPPLYHLLGLDPAMAGCILALDMGGYDIALALADNPLMAGFSGIVAASMFGCTVSFNIPVGMAMATDREAFTRGTLLGMIVMPLGILAGGIAGGIAPAEALRQMLPLILLSLMIALCLRRFPKSTGRAFAAFAALLRIIGVIGITAASVEYMTGYVLIPGMMPLNEVLIICGSVAILLLGSLPLAEMLRRLLRRPLAMLGKRFGMNETSVSALLIAPVALMPVLADLKNMDKRGRIVASAVTVCATAAIAEHLGFTAERAPEWIMPMLTGRIAGILITVCFALLMTKNEDTKPR